MRRALANKRFRRFLLVSLLTQAAAGSLRFQFVWLVDTLTDWDGAAGLIGIWIGLPALLLSLPAGNLSDRTDQRRLISSMSGLGGLIMALGSVLIAADVINQVYAAFLAVGVGVALAMLGPGLQAVVPRLVERDQLSTGVALQSMTQNISTFAGAVIGGVVIDQFGIATSFATMAGGLLLGGFVMLFVPIPEVEGADANAAQSSRSSMADGIGFVLAHEPIRSLLAVGLTVGTAGGLVNVSLPKIVRDELGRQASSAGALFALMGVGMFLSATFVATRRHIARPGLWLAVVASLIAGEGVIAAGWSRNYWLTALAMFCWGLGGGIVLTMQRIILQHHSPPEMMGRVMGANTLALAGAFPLAAGIAAVLGPAIGPPNALILMGSLIVVVMVLVTVRPQLRNATLVHDDP